MNNPTESKVSNKLCDAARGICDYKLKTDYNVKLEISKGDTTPECSHSFSGKSEHCIVKMAAVIAVGMLVIRIISSVCALISRLLNE
jgi:hypothetical protein